MEKENNIIKELKWRNILKDVSNTEKIIKAGNLGKGIYCGFDPTSDSLHLGNLLQIILLYRFAIFGFQPIAVIGGTTAMIGDPSGKNKERNLLSEDILKENVTKITKQLALILTSEENLDINTLEFIKKNRLLEAKDYDSLKMIIKSINPNEQYRFTLVTILKKLPLPWTELNLEFGNLKELYDICKINSQLLLAKNNLDNASFKELLNYYDNFVQGWKEFSLLPLNATVATKPIKIVNNQKWLSPLTVTNFLRDIGKNFNINQMLSKEMVANRLENGISYTEFSYMVLQAYDFYYLYEHENCCIQSGGSDQWGNITSGLDLIRKYHGENHQAAGITINLLTKSNGEKFGKSESGAIYLDSNKTSTYEMYQFLINQEDKDLKSLFNALTLFSEEQINIILTVHNQNLKLRVGQKILASLISTFVHKLEGYFSALRVTNALFNDQIHKMKVTEIIQVLKDVPNFKSTEDETVINLLVNNKICPSKRIVREMISQGSIMVNGFKVVDEHFLVTKKNSINNSITVIKKGKRSYYLIFHN